MRISTTQFYDRSISRLDTLNAQADKLQTQIATTKRFTSAAEDTLAFQRVSVLNRLAADDTAYGRNIKTAQASLDQADTTLSGITSQLQRVSEFAVQANNGTYSDSDREGIAATLDAILDDVLSLANTKDSRGQPLFAGTGGTTAFTRDASGAITYAGSGPEATVPIDAEDSMAVSTDGEKLFSGAGGGVDIFAAISDLAAKVRSGASTGDSITTLEKAMQQVTTAQASIGARGARLELESARLQDVATDREAQRSALEDTDVTSAIANLQKTLTALQATQASFTKLEGLSLFDYLR
ncbi:flagellar hook-associated protein FlgL [Stakelama saccharophila]|uniref:Flagellar hook-associated protein FlgL n=1 Tax=Stakelama saccharophila TaxID=3075605 RepID=A0ABZ0B8E3_9SPHN|nr:flagellar hook-associated protein FlgL [Stakelama sp. W311]WNO53669.1 flagellar hook-associated protein FlgL [Stakelama sp. W311]